MATHLVVTLIRHGLTDWNQERRYQGWSDQPLSDEGINEINKWFVPNANLIFTSDMQRAIATAKLLYPDKSVRSIANLRECHFGDWEGKTYQDLCDDPLYRQWVADPVEIIPPNGEGFAQFVERVMLGWEQLIELATGQTEREIAVVVHGGTIRAILSQYSDRSFWDWQIEQGMAVELVLELGEGGYSCTSLREVALTENETGSSSITI